LLAIGSNIKPHKHIPWVLKKMKSDFIHVKTGRFFRTKALNIVSAHVFWNGALQLETNLSSIDLKKKLVSWEIASGRNRRDPLSSSKDRTLDLDILWSSQEGWFEEVSYLKQLPYVWGPVCSVIPCFHLYNRSSYRPLWFKLGCKLVGVRCITLK